MTALLTAPPRSIPAVDVFSLGPARLLHGLDPHRSDRVTWSDHRAAHGPVPSLDRTALCTLLDAADLRGRGGAAFPLAAKIRGLRAGRPVVVVNGAEGEPASAKDFVLLTRAPNLVLDGAVIVAAAIGARRVQVGVTDVATEAATRAAANQRQDGTVHIEVRRVPNRFIAGEARALLSALDGGDGRPPGRRVLPTEQGSGGRPTVLSNAETFAQVAVLARMGAEAFARAGTPAEPGTTLLSVSGAVARPAVVEVPLGTTLAEVAAAVGARPAQAVLVGGYHGAFVRPDPRLPLSRDGLARAGGTLGAGAVVFLGLDTCLLGEVARVAKWLAGESARQCGPCAFGLPALAQDLADLAGGHAAAEMTGRHLRQVDRRGACAHPDGAVRFARSALVAGADELRTHRAHGGCGRPVRGQLALTRMDAFGARP